MDEKFKSGKEYVSPLIDVAELNKPDVLQSSMDDNTEKNLQDAMNESGGDFISFILNGLNND